MRPIYLYAYCEVAHVLYLITFKQDMGFLKHCLTIFNYIYISQYTLHVSCRFKNVKIEKKN